MIFFRMFIMTFFFSWTAWGVLDQKDWEEDKAMVSSILVTYRSHYVRQSVALEKIKRTNPRGFTKELSEIQNASKTFLLWGNFLSALEKVPFNIDEIIKVLGAFPFVEQRNFLEKMMITCPVLPARGIYEESYALLNTVHSMIQQYFQEHSDRVRAGAGYLDKYEKIKKILWDVDAPYQGANRQIAYETVRRMFSSEKEISECVERIRDNIEAQKGIFWVPSHQRHADLYRARIENFERFLEYVKDVSHQEVSSAFPSCADEAQASSRPPHLQEAKAGKEETTFSKAQEERVRLQDEREPPEDSKDSLVLKEEKPESSSRTEKFAQAFDVSQGATAEGDLEFDTVLAEQLELQFQKDREAKLKRKERKKNVSKKDPSGEEPSSPLNPSAKSSEEDIKDHPTLQRIFRLDINLKTEEFMDFFHKTKLQIKEADGGITIWFSNQVSKVFHRFHAAGNVVPYIDLIVAKKALKNINIVPRFK